jgi:hypothetical protein
MAEPSEEVAEVFAILGDLEKEFAEVELDVCMFMLRFWVVRR